MFLDVDTPQALGLLIRATRKGQMIRMDDLAGSAGVGPVFVREAERGKETVQIGRVFRLLSELGIQIKADVPDEVLAAYVALKLKGVKPLKPRQRKAAQERSEDASMPKPAPTDPDASNEADHA